LSNTTRRRLHMLESAPDTVADRCNARPCRSANVHHHHGYAAPAGAPRIGEKKAHHRWHRSGFAKWLPGREGRRRGWSGTRVSILGRAGAT
jgi:hypothetical protein